MQGADYSYWRPSGPSQLAGISFVARYLSNTPSKNLSLSEANQLASWGVSVVANWESSGQGGSYAQGVADAQNAVEQAAACGMPAGRPIYFSIDVDVDPSSTDAYREGVCSVISASEVGVYGSAAVCQHWRAAGCGWAWRTMSTDWQGGSSTSGCQVAQTGGNDNYDYDTALVQDVGQWMPGHSVAPVAAPVAVIANPATHNPFTPLAKDGVFGTQTIQATQLVIYAGHTADADGVWGQGSRVTFQNNLAVGLLPDGVIGEITVKAFQNKLFRVGARDASGAAIEVDGNWGSKTTQGLQDALNRGVYNS